MNKQVKRNKAGVIVSRGIEWVGTPGLDNGYTSNPVGGCHYGCRWTMPDGTEAICYAERVAEGLARSAFPNGFAPVGERGRTVYWRPGEIAAWKWHLEPCEIFVGSQSDLFGPWVPELYVQKVLDGMRECPQHRFYILTKNPGRLRYYTFPKNAWVGASVPPGMMRGQVLDVTEQEQMLWNTLHTLSQVSAEITWMSFEPLSFRVSGEMGAWTRLEGGGDLKRAIRWAVIGAASNGRKTYQPERAWVEELLYRLDCGHVPVFFKGNLDWPRDQWREDKPEVGQWASH